MLIGYARVSTSDQTLDLQKDALEKAGGRDDLATLIGNPMLLTALCILYESGGRLPEDRYELYKQIVNTVLFHRFPGDAREREPIKARLEAIALGMHTGEEDSPRPSPAPEVSQLEVDRLLRAFAAEDSFYEDGRVKPAVRREELLTRSGLLLPRPNNRAAFYHSSFQEFFAAERIIHTHDDLRPIFHERAAIVEWRLTLMFLFAGKIASTLKEHFRQLALKAMDDEVELQARQTLAVCLGWLGDPRISSLREPSAYVEVPIGIYPYGDAGKTVEIAAPFRIGRYPVTNSQYQAFIDDGGYRERRWWSEDGWAWRQRRGVTEPVYWRDRRWKGPNQPVVGVSFWEAEACSRWGGGRLPREEEWEAAARGPEGYAYPWGNAWQDGICNTAEAGLGGTSPVGLFPQSRQARLGIDDLAGNVWEWCGSLYDLSDTEDPSAPRVLRGGSWFDLDVARSSLRYRGVPYDRDINVGFRTVSSSLSSSTGP